MFSFKPIVGNPGFDLARRDVLNRYIPSLLPESHCSCEQGTGDIGLFQCCGGADY
jgi:hypothetical protein